MTFYYLNALGMWEYNERNFDKVLMQACVKISYLLYNAHQLLLRGEYGVANILLRQVFEYLVIGKYFYKQQNEIWAEKPAKKIRSRFDEKTTNDLLKTNWWEWNDKKIEEYANLFNDPEKFNEKFKKL